MPLSTNSVEERYRNYLDEVTEDNTSNVFFPGNME